MNLVQTLVSHDLGWNFLRIDWSALLKPGTWLHNWTCATKPIYKKRAIMWSGEPLDTPACLEAVAFFFFLAPLSFWAHSSQIKYSGFIPASWRHSGWNFSQCALWLSLSLSLYISVIHRHTDMRSNRPSTATNIHRLPLCSVCYR